MCDRVSALVNRGGLYGTGETRTGRRCFAASQCLCGLLGGGVGEWVGVCMALCVVTTFHFSFLSLGYLWTADRASWSCLCGEDCVSCSMAPYLLAIVQLFTLYFVAVGLMSSRSSPLLDLILHSKGWDTFVLPHYQVHVTKCAVPPGTLTFVFA